MKFVEHFLANADRYLKKGLGFVVFGATRDLVDMLHSSLGTRFFVTDLWPVGSGFPEDLVPIYWCSKDSLLTHAEVIAKQIIMPKYRRRKSIILVSEASQTDLQSKPLDINSPNLWGSLALEQMLFTLEEACYVFDRPDGLDAACSTYFTVIEEKMKNALDTASIEWKAQQKVGPFHADFLVKLEHKTIAVECDGRGFHEIGADTRRDRYFEISGIPVIRFSGSNIYSNPNSCIEDLRAYAACLSKISRISKDTNLDSSQEEALRVVDGPVRVFAPAGSGKTKTLVNRIAHMVDTGIPALSILALAFNRKAADEMRQRLAVMGVKGVDVRTFNSFGHRVIMDQRTGWRFEESETHLRTMVEHALDTCNVKIKRHRDVDPLAKYLDALRAVKLGLANPAEIEIDEEDVNLPCIINKIRQEQVNHQIFFFDDQIEMALRLLLRIPEERKRVQKRYEYILVDEYQDLNKAQIMMVRLIAMPQNNVFVVGDDDQLIYGWRLADMRYIREFENSYSDTRTITLRTNYRSAARLVRHAKWLIDHNVMRVKKEFVPQKDAPDGIISVDASEGILKQAMKTGDWIKKHEKNNDWANWGVLFRYKESLPIIQIALNRLNIPHWTPLDQRNIFSRRIGRDILNYLRLSLLGEKVPGNILARILNRPNRYLTNNFCEAVKNLKKPWDKLVLAANDDKLNQCQRDKIQGFIDLTIELHNLSQSGATTKDVIQNICNRTNLKQYYRENVKSKTLDADAYDDADLIPLFIGLAEDYPDIKAFLEKYDESDTGPASNANRTYDTAESRNAVRLLTVHRAKGMEFDSVVFFDAHNPRGSLTEGQFEEERRVFYVAVTRPIHRLLITTRASQHNQFVQEYMRSPLFANTTDVEVVGLYEKSNRKSAEMRAKRERLEHKVSQFEREEQQLEKQSSEMSRKLDDPKRRLSRAKKELENYDEQRRIAEGLVGRIRRHLFGDKHRAKLKAKVRECQERVDHINGSFEDCTKNLEKGRNAQKELQNLIGQIQSSETRLSDLRYELESRGLAK